jgi:crossover junction endodeoxyribonuclease RuvC
MMLLGLDPGIATAALAALEDHSVIALVDLPVHMIPARGRGLRAELDVPGLHALLAGLAPVDHVFVENVGPMPKQGIISTWRFAEAYGAIKAVVLTMGMPLTLVPPKAWQRFHGIGPAPDEARQRAVRLYPDAIDQLRRRRDNHRADALLIADYGRRQLGSTLQTADAAADAAERRCGAGDGVTCEQEI